MVSTSAPQPAFLVGDVVGDIFQQLASAYQHPACQKGQSQSKETVTTPDVDLYETTEAILIDVALPGVSKDSISVEYDTKTHRIAIAANSTPHRHSADEAVTAVRLERPTGRFERIVGLNKKVILASDISAKYEDGVLQIVVPKDPKAELKHKISIA
jgi:HSP20 family protein